MQIEKLTHDIKPKKCPICGGVVKLVKSTAYKSGYMYECESCKARVGTFKKNPDIAMGTLADSETRKKRLEVHKLFDRFWKRSKGRTHLYYELAKELGVEYSDAHFGTMNMEQLLKAEQILLEWWRKKYDK